MSRALNEAYLNGGKLSAGTTPSFWPGQGWFLQQPGGAWPGPCGFSILPHAMQNGQREGVSLPVWAGGRVCGCVVTRFHTGSIVCESFACLLRSAHFLISFLLLVNCSYRNPWCIFCLQFSSPSCCRGRGVGRKWESSMQPAVFQWEQ